MLHVSAPVGEFSDDIKEYRHLLNKTAFHEQDFVRAEASLQLPETREFAQSAIQCNEELCNENLKYHVVIGIGGSNLGAKAIYDALYGLQDMMDGEQVGRPRLLFAETIDSRWLLHFRKSIVTKITDLDQILVTVISKSGNTTETIANAEIILHDLEVSFDRENIMKRVVVISDEGSKLWQYAQDNRLKYLPIPHNVGGRYSVFSSAGLFPLVTVGINVEVLLKGAREVLGWYLAGDINDDQALRTALYMSGKYFAGRMIHDSFYFEPSLESIGKWQRQLIGESIGKSEMVGLTPTVSIGTTDLHSVGQLYIAGPHHRMTEFVFVRGCSPENIPVKRFMPELVEVVNGKHAHEIMQAIVTGTKRSYETAGRSFYEVTLDELDAWHLGAYMQYKMLTVMYVAKLCGVDAFNQPAVEDYKREARAILEA